MHSTDTRELFELDVQEFELTDSAETQDRSGPRTITTCAIC
ncbi:hypothetical protein [Lentzea sp. NPDC059081]